MVEDVAGECNAQLHIGDDFGDNHTTIRCGLESDHKEPHKEVFERRGRPVEITWYGCCREEEEKSNAVYEAEFGPYCDRCDNDHHGECEASDDF